MARTVDRNQTLEDFRGKHNELASDVGTITGLRGSISNGNNLVDAINELEDKTFYFETFEYVATASQQTFTGADLNGRVLTLRSNRYQVFLNDVSAGTSKHLIEGTDYAVGAFAVDSEYKSVVLTVGAAVNDIVTVYAFSGSVTGTAGTGGPAGQFTETVANSIYNINSNGVILNGDSDTRTVTLQSGYTIQLAGKTYAEDDIVGAAGKKFQAPIISDGVAQFTGGTGTSFVAITSTDFTGNLAGNVTGDLKSPNGTVLLENGSGDGADSTYSGEAGTVNSLAGHLIAEMADVVTVGTRQNDEVLTWDNGNTRWINKVNTHYTDTNTNALLDANLVDHGNHNNITAARSVVSGEEHEIILTGLAIYGDNEVQAYMSGGLGLTMSGTGQFSANVSNGIEINSDNIELDYEVVSSAPGSASGTTTGHLWFVT